MHQPSTRTSVAAARRHAARPSRQRGLVLGVALGLCCTLPLVTGCGQKGPLTLPQASAPTGGASAPQR